MKLIVYNGSPRGKNSNTRLLMDEFIYGFTSGSLSSVEIFYLASKSQREEGANAYATADAVILAFPLYTDSMPGIVKEFIEKLAIYDGLGNNPAMGYVVQSGFPEPNHSRYVEKYLEKLTKRLRSKYLGTAVKGGVEGIRIMPPWMTRKLMNKFYKLGREYALSGEFDKDILKQLAPREHLSKSSLFMFRLLHNSHAGNFYWNKMLKENSAFEQRFARPYEIKSREN